MAATTSSKSVRLLGGVLAAGAVVAAATSGPDLLAVRATSTVVDVQPQLLLVDDAVKGVKPLGRGMTVSLYDSGLQVRRDGLVIFETVRIGSPLSAGSGAVSGTGSARVEHVSDTVDSLHIRHIAVAADQVVYRGDLIGAGGPLPATITLSRSGAGVDVQASVPGADLVVLHTERPQAPQGVQPALPDVRLRGSSWWVPDGSSPSVQPSPSAQSAQPAQPEQSAVSGQPLTTVPVMTSAVRGNRSTTSVAATSDVVVDLRHQGRGEIHVWASTLRITVR